MTTTAAAIAHRGGTGVRPGSGPTRYLDHGRTVTIEPDLTWYDSHDKPVAVLDAKYKTITAGKTGPNADMYQMTAYCTAVDRAGLADAGDEDRMIFRERTHSVPGGRDRNVLALRSLSCCVG